MKTHYLKVEVMVKVESDLTIEEVTEQFGSETNYNFGSTDDVKVLETELLEVVLDKSEEREENEIPITYGLIKATCGWSKFCDVTGKNHYAINEWGHYPDNEIFRIPESQAKKLNFI